MQLRPLLLDKVQDTCALALRSLRYMTSTPKAFSLLRHCHIHTLVARCIEYDSKPAFLKQRLQALKLVARWLEVAPASLPLIFARTLVAVAGQTEDGLKKPAVEVLRRCAVLRPECCAWSGGLKTVVKSVTDPGCGETSECVVLTLLFLINDPTTRRYFYGYSDIEVIWSIFTETCTTQKEMKPDVLEHLEASLKLAKRALVVIMKNWSGLIFLAADPNGLQSLIQALNQPIRPIVKRAIFDVFFEIFSVAYDEAKYKTPIDNVLDCYMAMVVHAFVQCGIYEVLYDIVAEAENECRVYAQRLLKQIMQLSDKIYPGDPTTIPLVELATSPNSLDPTMRSEAAKALRELRVCCRSEIETTAEMRRAMSRTFLEAVEFMSIKGGACRERLRDIWGPLKMELNYDLESPQLVALVKATCVSNYENDDARWDWNLLLELFENILQRPERLKETLGMTLVEPLLKFFQPGKGKFIERPWNKENFVCAKVGYYVVQCMLKVKKGRSRLATPKKGRLFSKKSFLCHYIDHLNIVEAYTEAVKEGAKSPDNEHYFSRKSITTTMAREYFSWLGLFTKAKDCIDLLEGLDIFSYLRRLADPSGLNDHLCVLVINNFDYTFEAPRNLLQLWIERGSTNLILYILEHLRIIYKNSQENFSQWCIDILVTQIYADREVIAMKALSVIEEVCESTVLIQAILNKWPQIDKLQLGGDLFLAKFLRIDEGVKYFQEFSWIDGAIERWMQSGNRNFVEAAEMAIYKEINVTSSDTKDSLQFHVPPDCPLDVRNDVVLHINSRCRYCTVCR